MARQNYLAGHFQKQRWTRSLEREACSKLNNSRLARGSIFAERTTGDARVKSSELSVIEGVECLDPQLKAHPFRQFRFLRQDQIPVVDRVTGAELVSTRGTAAEL